MRVTGKRSAGVTWWHLAVCLTYIVFCTMNSVAIRASTFHGRVEYSYPWEVTNGGRKDRFKLIIDLWGKLVDARCIVDRWAIAVLWDVVPFWTNTRQPFGTCTCWAVQSTKKLSSMRVSSKAFAFRKVAEVRNEPSAEAVSPVTDPCMTVTFVHRSCTSLRSSFLNLVNQA
jgi:hypothetical protein